MKLFAGLGVGALAGFLYYKLVGCSSGTCPITSNPYTSVLYGAIVGAIISGGLR